MKTMRLLLTTAILMAFTNIALADTQKIERMAADKMESFSSDILPWADEPILPKGAKSALILGDPSKAGVFVARLKFPPNYQIPAHTHPFTEIITVLKGKLGNGMGDTLDVTKGEVLEQSDSFVLPAGHAHYVWTEDEETIVELIATGPWDITYTNPADDPSKRK